MKFPTPASYPYCHFDFDEWNPVQRQISDFLDEKCNLVVASGTATGKTAIAEAAMGVALAESDSSVAVYVSPLKALNEQHFSRWARHVTFEDFPKCLLSSENPESKGLLDESRIVVSTVESLAIQCRLSAGWIRRVSALVFDEAHLIGDASRGPVSEEMLMAFTAINPTSRVVLLSGTMHNAKEIASWLKSLNGLPTRFVSSSWRPSPIEYDVVAVKDFWNSCAEEAVKASRGKKTLVFVQSKRLGEEIVRRLASRGIRCGFFHSGLPRQKKELMVSEFKSEWSDLGIMVCTSSLGMGIDI